VIPKDNVVYVLSLRMLTGVSDDVLMKTKSFLVDSYSDTEDVTDR
jgi:hypothetical protein